ncbi:MAG: hypothetical protein PHO18_02740 [Synergistaceae bacterium]|nr:hypothetical protein [Synergistaceae bacterium]
MKEGRSIKLKPLAVFVLSLLITLWLSIFRINDDDRVWFTLNIPEESTKVITVDIAEFNPIKYYVQPCAVSIYGRIKNPTGQRNLTADFTGAEAFLSQGSKKSKWTLLAPGDFLIKDRRGNMPINIEMSIPSQGIRQHSIAKAILNIRCKGEIISRIYFHIINSKY